MTKNNGLYVVGIGASAGGVEVLQEIFDHLPANPGMAFVIVQHLSPKFKSMMDELLKKHTKMEVKIAEHGEELEKNTVYLNRKDKNIRIKDKKIELIDKDPAQHINLPIDIFFHSLGEEFQDKSIAVILSGTGSDGSRGIRTIKGYGGTIFVQEPATAQFDGMPNSAIRTNLVDSVNTVEAIAKELIKFPSKQPELEGLFEDDHEDVFNQVLDEIYRSSGIDFHKYKDSTLLRRLKKRIDLNNIVNLADYLELLKQNDNEKEIIKKEFLIGVTQFFRDAQAFEVITEQALPLLFKEKPKNEPLRIWLPGCSTGEEAYSLAIKVDEYIRQNKIRTDYKIFATDVDKEALKKASAAIYPVNILADLDKNVLQNYFQKTGDQYQVIKRIREKIVFSYHDLLRDPPFIRMDLISCRNLLIYLKFNTQMRILTNFKFSLNQNGILFLGNSENLGSIQKYFEVVDSKWRIYQNLTPSKFIPTDFDISSPMKSYDNKRKDYEVSNRSMSDSTSYSSKINKFNEYLIYRFSPTVIFIDKDYNLLFTKGNASDYLRMQEGMFSQYLMDLVDENLSSIIRNGINKLMKEKQSIVFDNIALEKKDEKVNVRLRFEEVKKEKSGNEEIYLIIFEEKGKFDESVKTFDSFMPDEFSRQRINDLEEELRRANQEKQNVIEELETSNEELQSSNEELLASNEELQSTNEELQSVNEELYTVNTELQQKNKELNDLNNDIDNLLNSTEIATLFLDSKFAIRKYTPQIKNVFNLEESDIGRTIDNFASNFKDITGSQLINDSKKVIESDTPIEREVTSDDNKIFLKRINPFKKSNGEINGVVITFVDITEFKKVKSELFFADETIKQAFDIGPIAWWDWRVKSGEVEFHDKKAEMLGYKKEDFKSLDEWLKILHPDDYDKAMEEMRQHLYGNKDKYLVTYRIKAKDGNYKWFTDQGAIVERNDKNEPVRLLGVVMDITELKTTQDHLETALTEKDALLKEVYHRVKNNMQVLAGLIDMQADHINDEKVKEKLQKSKQQIRSMAVVHEKLYKSNNFSEINLAEYINSLSNELLRSYMAGGKVIIELDTVDVYTDINTAIPVGLVLNEIISNSIKYAFPEADNGKIQIKLDKSDNDKVKINVSDNGIGLPENFDTDKTNTSGMELIKLLIEDQLDGDLSIKNNNGVNYNIEFKI